MRYRDEDSCESVECGPDEVDPDGAGPVGLGPAEPGQADHSQPYRQLATPNINTLISVVRTHPGGEPDVVDERVDVRGGEVGEGEQSGEEHGGHRGGSVHLDPGYIHTYWLGTGLLCVHLYHGEEGRQLALTSPGVEQAGGGEEDPIDSPGGGQCHEHRDGGGEQRAVLSGGERLHNHLSIVIDHISLLSSIPDSPRPRPPSRGAPARSAWCRKRRL